MFCRFSNLFTSAKFDIPLNPDTTVDFFQFPNRLFNIVVFRDERTVNVTAVVDFSLVLNASDTALVAAHKDRRFEVRLNTRNDKYMLIQNFNVTFLDGHNTSIATVGNGSNSMDMDVFYNCGDLSLDYVVSDLLNGPNY